MTKQRENKKKKKKKSRVIAWGHPRVRCGRYELQIRGNCVKTRKRGAVTRACTGHVDSPNTRGSQSVSQEKRHIDRQTDREVDK